MTNKSLQEIEEKFVEGRDYEYVGIQDDPGWAIRNLGGKYDQAIVHYTNIKLHPINADGSELTLAFDFDILNPTVLPKDCSDDMLGQYLGDLLMVAIQTGLDNGTAELDEGTDDGQLKQDYPTITLD